MTEDENIGADLPKIAICSEEDKKVWFFPPSERGNVAIGTKPKTAALICDQVWWPVKHFDSEHGYDTLESVRIGHLNWECWVSFGDKEDYAILSFHLGKNMAQRALGQLIFQKYNSPSVAIYSSSEMRDQEYRYGEYQAIVTTLANLQIVDEGQLSWEQVTEFRKDKQAQRKYRRFVHWLDKDMIGKPLSFIEDEISVRADDYAWSLKKHGIRTALGVIEETLDGKFLVGAASTTGAFTLAGHPELGVLVGTGLIVGKTIVRLCEVFLDFTETRRGTNYEISWVYELKQKFNK